MVCLQEACASSVNHATLPEVLNQTQLNSVIKRRLRLSSFFFTRTVVFLWSELH